MSEPVARDGGGRRQVVLVSGLSGAGKASILRALEDVGFEAIDNPPLALLDSLVERGAQAVPRNIAVGVDARSRGFDAEAVVATLARLRSNPTLVVELVFAWADEVVLMRRYTETRRRHPLAPNGRVADGIAAEQSLTAPLHTTADLLVDTSDLPLPTLRRLVEARYGSQVDPGSRAGLAVTLTSFAFPAGLPRDADMVFDARFLRNPHYVSALRQGTGRDPEVAAYVEADPDFPAFFSRLGDLLGLLLPRFVQEGKKYVNIGVGCTGGRHRSVHIVEKLSAKLTEAGWRVITAHRELAREGDPAPMVSGVSSVQAQEA
jgi:UPF0042 nucleotide-binding protein